jgi:hypothetical protein
MIQPNPIPDRSLLPIKHIDSWEEWKINNQDVTPFLESSARGTRSSPQSGLHFEAVKYLNHNSRFDPLFGPDALRSIHTNPNRARQVLPAPTRKGGDARQPATRCLFRFLNANKRDRRPKKTK